MEDIDIDHLVSPKIERRILLVCDTWSSTRDGISAVNQSLALNLARFKGTRIFSTILGSTYSVKHNDKHNDVELIPSTSGPLKQLYRQLDSDPGSVYPDLISRAPKISFIIGHAPITAKAALHFRDTLYPKAKVILFYHVIPRDVEWLEASLPYPIPDDNTLVELAERAEAVYSVTDKCHWYFTAKFRNRAKQPIDHRKFFPQCQENVFSVRRKQLTASGVSDAKPAKILALCDGGDLEVWQGTDIAVVTVSKIAAVLRSKGKEVPSLKIGGLSEAGVAIANKRIGEFPNPNRIKIEACCYESPRDMYRDLEEYDICLVPSRAEPFGNVGIAALSAGIPTLIAKESATATIVSRLTSEPEFFTVPVTPTPLAYRQDGSMWRDRALELLQDPVTAQERATQLRTALKRDEPTKQSHDDVVTYCLGGIQLLHDATAIEMLYAEDDEKELLKLREFNQFLTAVMKQCWRLKHHPLTQEHDLFQILPGISLPIKELLQAVTDKIEEKDRRIVGVDETTGAFLVYCPTSTALTDLWARCDSINNILEGILLRGNKPGPVLRSFSLEHAQIRTSIKGPDFLRYKQELMRNLVV